MTSAATPAAVTDAPRDAKAPEAAESAEAAEAAEAAPANDPVQANGKDAPRRIPLWVDLRHVPLNKRLPYFAAIRQAAAERVVFAKGDDHLGRDGFSTLAIDGKGKLLDGRAAVGRLMAVQDAKQQARAARQDGVVILEETPGRIIPIENLLALRQDRPGTVFARATSPKETALCAAILQRGVDGILLAPTSAADIRAAAELLTAAHADAAAPGAQRIATVTRQPSATPAPASRPTVAPASVPGPVPRSAGGLRLATVTAVTDAGPGDRVCVDTTSILKEGEGMLVGSCAHSLALVLAETAANPVINARPFRVNAGAVHSYCLVADGRTAYLSELAAGSKVVVAGPAGTRLATVGRVKVETRPHRILHWETPRGPASVALQLAETVRVAGLAGAVCVTDVQAGMALLVQDQDVQARHAGIAIATRVEER